MEYVCSRKSLTSVLTESIIIICREKISGVSWSAQWKHVIGHTT
jgi:hypothetical protein